YARQLFVSLKSVREAHDTRDLFVSTDRRCEPTSGRRPDRRVVELPVTRRLQYPRRGDPANSRHDTLHRNSSALTRGKSFAWIPRYLLLTHLRENHSRGVETALIAAVGRQTIA